MYKVAIITLSDKGARGEREDVSGRVIREMVEAAGYQVSRQLLLNDDREGLAQALREICDGGQAELILTTGGTGFSPRDNAPEATMDVVERPVPGIAEAMRYHSLSITPRGMLSRAVSGIRGRTLIVNLPGSPGGKGKPGIYSSYAGSRPGHPCGRRRGMRPQVSSRARARSAHS